MSADVDAELRARAFELGADGVYEKSELLRVLPAALAVAEPLAAEPLSAVS